MRNQSANALQGGHHIRCETPRPRMAKASLPDLTLREKRAEYGAILRRASEIAGMDRNQTADALKVGDPSQISKWWSGEENPQTWRYYQHVTLRRAYLRAQAEKETAGVTIRTVIEIEEKAA